MRPDRMVLSAYLDGEVPERFVPDIEAAIAVDAEVRREYEELLWLRQRLDTDPPVDIGESARRSRLAIEARLRSAPARMPVWRRTVSLPLPALAAAALVVIALAGVILWSLLPGGRPSRNPLARGSDVDVTIRVDGSNMEHVLQWLVDQNKLGEVNIQLPEQRFQIVGEPVLLKPARYEEETSR